MINKKRLQKMAIVMLLMAAVFSQQSCDDNAPPAPAVFMEIL